MKGRNTITLTQEAVIEAMQEYLDKRFPVGTPHVFKCEHTIVGVLAHPQSNHGLIVFIKDQELFLNTGNA